MKKLIIAMALTFGMLYVNAEEPLKESTVKKTEYKSIEGKITDHFTGEALAGVSLKIKGVEKKIFTDLDCNFSIQGVEPGIYDIEIDYVSYKDVTLKSVSTSDSDVKLKVELESMKAAIK